MSDDTLWKHVIIIVVTDFIKQSVSNLHNGLRYKQGKQSCYLNFTEIDTFFPRIVFLFHSTKKSSKIYRVIG